MSEEIEYEVVWSGGELLPPTSQELYQLLARKRNLVSLGLITWNERGESTREASIDRRVNERRQEWRRRQVVQREAARRLMKRAKSYMTPPSRPRDPKRAKLDDDTVRRIRAAYAKGEGGATILGRRFGVSTATVSLIVHRAIYRHVV